MIDLSGEYVHPPDQCAVLITEASDVSDDRKGIAPITGVPYTANEHGLLICDECHVPIMYGCACIVENRLIDKLLKKRR